MRYVSLMRNAVRVYASDTGPFILEPSGTEPMARLIMLDRDLVDGVEHVSVAFVPTLGLPAPIDGVALVVDEITALRLHASGVRRTDIFYPSGGGGVPFYTRLVRVSPIEGEPVELVKPVDPTQTDERPSGVTISLASETDGAVDELEINIESVRDAIEWRIGAIDVRGTYTRREFGATVARTPTWASIRFAYFGTAVRMTWVNDGMHPLPFWMNGESDLPVRVLTTDEVSHLLAIGRPDPGE